MDRVTPDGRLMISSQDKTFKLAAGHWETDGRWIQQINDPDFIIVENNNA